MRKVSVNSLISGESRTPPTPSTQLKMGIEIEIESLNNPTAIRQLPSMTAWNIVSDGSLRDSGGEFVSNILTDEEAPIAIDAFYETFRLFRLKSSIRCGIHVHLNCTDMYFDDLDGIFTTYCLLEPALFNFCGPVREENIYCVPWYRSNHEVDRLAKALRDKTLRSIHIRGTLSNLCKYSALNAGPLMRFGTIEFRHAPTWTDQSTTKRWVQLLRSLFLFGKTRTATDVLSYWHDNPERWYEQILGRAHGASIATLIEQADTCGAVCVAEKFLPERKTRMEEWNVPPIEVSGTGVDNYAVSPPPRFTVDRRPTGEAPPTLTRRAGAALQNVLTQYTWAIPNTPIIAVDTDQMSAPTTNVDRTTDIELPAIRHSTVTLRR